MNHKHARTEIVNVREEITCLTSLTTLEATRLMTKEPRNLKIGLTLPTT